MTIRHFEFDHLEHWKSDLSRALGSIVPSEIADILREANPEFISDARDVLFDVADRDPITDEVISWVEKHTVFAFHGTRLNADEFHSVENEGLKILRPSERRARLERALSRHPRWDSVLGEISSAINRHGPGKRLGRREGQVHLTLSRAGLTNGFPHYLNGGSEFDQNVAMDLLGADGVKRCVCLFRKSSVFFLNPPESAFASAELSFFQEVQCFDCSSACFCVIPKSSGRTSKLSVQLLPNGTTLA
ncbi:hypothetical protein [Ruegeria sp.]|uniref:hypothetical protein n=1 Tax=Ruegeria sp. TaxID=1879320 RepID=UPI0023108A9A|nr:hypothetical protein [Ruegeria sp.]MDA7964834.1 hypothetical protein [Ruegeria sp.]